MSFTSTRLTTRWPTMQSVGMTSKVAVSALRVLTLASLARCARAGQSQGTCSEDHQAALQAWRSCQDHQAAIVLEGPVHRSNGLAIPYNTRG